MHFEKQQSNPDRNAQKCVKIKNFNKKGSYVQQPTNIEYHTSDKQL